MKPSWEDAPVGARWLAQNQNGNWFWYKQQPATADREWDLSLGFHWFAGPGKPNSDWKHTLEERQ